MPLELTLFYFHHATFLTSLLPQVSSQLITPLVIDGVQKFLLYFIASKLDKRFRKRDSKKLLPTFSNLPFMC